MRENLVWKPNKGKLFYTLLALLLAFIILPLAAALVICFETLERSGEETRAALYAVIESHIQYWQAQSPARGHEEQLKALEAEYALLAGLGMADQPETGEEDLRRAAALLASLGSPGPEESSLYLYFLRSGLLLGGQAEDIPQAVMGVDPGRVGYSCSRYGYAEGLGYYINYIAVAAPGVYFVERISFGEAGRPSSQIAENLGAHLQNFELCCYDSFGNYLPFTEQHGLSALYDFEALGGESEQGSFSFQHDGHSYACYYRYNQDNRTKYALFYQDTSADSQRMAGLLLTGGGLCALAVCLALALFFVKKAYSPLDMLISRLPRREDGRIRDDYRVLSEALDSMDAKIRAQNRMLSRSCLLRLLKGQSVEGYEDCLPEALTAGEKGPFLAAGISLDGAPAGRYPDEESFEAALLAGLEGYEAYPLWEDGLLLLLFPLGGRDPAALMGRLESLGEEMPGCCISVSLSNLHQSAGELRLAYGEVKAVVEYCALMEKYGSLQRYGDIAPLLRGNAGPSSPVFGELQALSQAIAALSPKEAQRCYDMVAYRLSERLGWMPQQGDMEFSMLLNAVALAFYDIDLPGDVGKEIVQRHVEQLKAAANAGSLGALLQASLERLLGRSEKKRSDEERFMQIKAYIQENSGNSGLCAAMVAERFGVSPSNITRMFKKYNNTGFLEYVHLLRVSQASKLLAQTELTVEEIAARVGYANVITMFRAFKTYAHATPGTVRRLHFEGRDP